MSVTVNLVRLNFFAQQTFHFLLCICEVRSSCHAISWPYVVVFKRYLSVAQIHKCLLQCKCTSSPHRPHSSVKHKKDCNLYKPMVRVLSPIYTDTLNGN